MAKIITVLIDPNGGPVSVDLEGYKGTGCHAVQEGFEQALGKSTKVVRKPEYNKPCINTNVARH